MQTTENSCPLQDLADPRAESAAHLKKIDHAGADKQCSHDRGAVYETGVHRFEIAHKRDRRFIFNIAERIRIDHCHSCRAVLDPLV